MDSPEILTPEREQALIDSGRARERADLLAHIDAQRASVAAMIKRGDCGAEEGGLLDDRLRAFASGIRTGLHAVERADG